MEKLARDYHSPDVSDREIAIFELGIKLAALFHIIFGAPVANVGDVKKRIAEGIEASIKCQPFVKDVKVEIAELHDGMSHNYTKSNEYDYSYVSGKNLRAQVEINYNGWQAIGCVEWKSDLNYPMMYIKSVNPLE
ncbi:MAG: dihydroneopterin aldolase [Promethearchaeia archaeon]|nr:MAG: dihydroneopterin aldolase [Candidatus Lokiarchaeia archaeon]